ncbi:hypothetical protein diail_7458 [Diaporthe ilicicola]|nr:hypothetical protein diail_7458 [Diaporthe ilicicola]
MAEAIKSQSTNHTVTVTNINQIKGVDLTGVKTIALLEANDSILYNPDEDQILSNKHCALGGGGPKARHREADIALGLGRTVCTERGDQSVIAMNIASPEDANHSTSLITSVLERAATDGDQSWSESELAKVAGVLQIPRVAFNGRLNDVVTSRTHTPKMQICTIGPEVQKHISLSIKNPGLLDTLYFKEVARAGAPLRDGAVEI